MARYKIADLIMEFSPIYIYTQRLCEDYLTSESGDAQIKVPLKTDYSQEKAQMPEYAECYHEHTHIYRQICTDVIDFDGFLFHSSVVEYEGQAYIFTAPSGTGKSTHTRLWQKVFGAENARIINDDKPIVRKTDIFRIYGTPWSGKDNLNINTSAPIKGVCFLKRGENNSIRRLDKNQVIVPLMNQIYRTGNAEYMSKLLSLLDEFLAVTEFYELTCNISEQAAIVAYEGMSGKKAVIAQAQDL